MDNILSAVLRILGDKEADLKYIASHIVTLLFPRLKKGLSWIISEKTLDLKTRITLVRKQLRKSADFKKEVEDLVLPFIKDEIISRADSQFDGDTKDTILLLNLLDFILKIHGQS